MACSSTTFKLGNLEANYSVLKWQQNRLLNAQTQAILEALNPITLPTYDTEGHIIQIWQYHNSVLGAILDEKGHVTIVPSYHIHNGLEPYKTDNSFLGRIASLPPKKWGLIALANQHIMVWPHLEAAGKPGPDLFPVFKPGPDLSPAVIERNVGHIFRNSRGHLANDTKENRKLLISVSSDYRNWIGRNKYGADVFFKCQEDGSQVWVYRRGNLIENAGVNDKGHHSIFNCRSKLVEAWNKNPSVSVRVHNLTLKCFQGKGRLPPFEPFRGPGNRYFQQLLQQTNLTKSYNASHQGNAVPAKGGAEGTIGGVACGCEYIEGLFDGVESVFEQDHYFCVPLVDGQTPFSQEQLQQLLRELAIGIYAYGAVPFFSLHFNQNGDLFPVIHPAYQNTLVGRVIGMLDYFMKGYLNGAVFSEETIDNWNRRTESKEEPVSIMRNLYKWWYSNTPEVLTIGNWNVECEREEGPVSLLGALYNWWYSSQPPKPSLDKLIDFEEYCNLHLKGEDKYYLSVRSIQNRLEESGLLERLEHRVAIAFGEEEPRELSDFDGFKNSFRIIAKQNSFQKEGNLFVIDADFDVLYTIEPSFAYQEKLQAYSRKHGQMPASYTKLINIYEAISKQIHDHMVKMPMCREYFAMLGVINFFSSYFSTLKKHRKMPIPAVFKKIDTRGCPPLFPHLPLTASAKETLRINTHEIVKACSAQDLMRREIFAIVEHFRRHKTLTSFDRDQLDRMLLQETTANILSLSSSAFKRYLIKNADHISSFYEKIAKSILDGLLKIFEKVLEHYYTLPYTQRFSEIELIRSLVSNTHKSIPDKIEHVSKNIPYNSLFDSSQVSLEEREKNKRIVGGCGMQLEKQRIQLSRQASFVLENNLLPLAPETWEQVNMGDSKGAVFRFLFIDVPSGISDYCWMEFLEEGKSEKHQNWIEIQQAMDFNDHEEFKRCVYRVDDLSKVKGPNNTSLVHLAAKYNDDFYVRYLLCPATTDVTFKERLYYNLFLSWKSRPSLFAHEKDANGYLPIHYAAMMGCDDALRFLLEADPTSLNAVSVHGASPLITAIQHNQKFAVITLLQKNPKPALLTGGYTDLHCALHEGDLTIIKLVLASPIAVSCLNVCSEEGGTPLMLACELKSTDIVKELLAKGADATIARKDGTTAIEIAVRLKSVEVLQVLLKKAKPSPRALRAAVERGTVEMLDILLKKTSNILDCNNDAQDNLLHMALRHANFPVALYLTQDPMLIQCKNISSETPFQVAILMGAWQVAEALHTKGVQVDLRLLFKVKYNALVQKIFDSTPLTPSQAQKYLVLALQEGNELAITEILRPRGAKLEHFQPVHGWGAVHYLAKCNGVYLFKLAYTKDPLMPIKEEGNKTLAYIAAENASYSVFCYLVGEMKKYSISLENHYRDRHLLHAVIEARHMDCFDKMIDTFEGLENIVLNKEGMRPLHLAAKMASVEILRKLAEKEVDFTAKDQLNRTALHYAIRTKEESCIAFLLEMSIPVQAEDLYVAIGHDIIVQMLMKTNPDQAILNHALYLAVCNSDKQAFLCLHALGASFNHVTPKGWTPTLHASYHGQLDILEVLLQSVPLDHRVMNGNNALDLACKEGHSFCAKMLKQAGYKPDQLEKAPQSSSPILIETFLESLKNNEVGKIRKTIKQIPADEKISTEFEGKKIWGTALQLLVRFSKNPRLIAKLLRSLEYDPDLPDSEGNTLVHLLVLAGMNLLSSGQYHLPNHQGQTPLHLAAAKGDIAIIKKLLCKLSKEELNVIDHKGRNSVFSAIENNQIVALRVLAEAGADLTCWDDQLITPLILASRKRSLAMVRILSEKGANLNQLGGKYITALHLLIGLGENEIARYIIMQGANPHIFAKDTSPIHLAASLGNIELLYILRAKGVSLNLKDDLGWQIQHRAAFNGKIPVLETVSDLRRGLLDASLDTPLEPFEKQVAKGVFEGATPLHLAALANNEETVDWLLVQGANPELQSTDRTDSLSFAAKAAGSAPLIKRFTKYSFAQDPKIILSAIAQTIAEDNLDGSRALYRLGIPVDAVLYHGNTGLHLACRYGSLECTSWLLEQNADPLLENYDLQNAYQIAAVNSSFEQFKALLEYAPIDLDEVFQIGEEPLIHKAALKGNIQHVMLLIANGAFVDHMSIRGFTPFHRAVKANCLELAKLLLFCGADGQKRSREESFEELTRFLPEERVHALQQILEDVSALSELCEPKLHRAVRGHYPLAVRMLAQIEDLEQHNSTNQTALDVAVETNQTEVIRYLSSLMPVLADH